MRWKEDTQFKLDANRNLINYDQNAADTYSSWVGGAQPQSLLGNWQSLGPTAASANMNDISGIGRVNCIVIDPSNSNFIYVGTPGGGLWRSIDGGVNWIVLTDKIVGCVGISGIAIDPNSDPSNRIIYILTGDGFDETTTSLGVYKSSDNGFTWNKLGLSITSATTGNSGYKIMVNPSLAYRNYLYVAMRNGLFMSTNGGATWSQKISLDPITDIEFKPNTSSVIYAGSMNGKVYRSEDYGVSWTTVLTLSGNYGFTLLGVTPANSSYVYAIFQGAASAGYYTGLYRSTNSGTLGSFSLMSTSPGVFSLLASGSGTPYATNYNGAFAVSPTNSGELFTGSVNAWKSTNSGSTWINKSSISKFPTSPKYGPTYMHEDFHDFVYSNDGLSVYCANDGGIYRSSDGGNTWVNLSGRLPVSKSLTVSSDQTATNHLITSAWDDGVFRLNNSNNVFYTLIEGDGAGSFFDPKAVPSKIYYSTDLAPTYYSQVIGNTKQNITPANPLLLCWSVSFPIYSASGSKLFNCSCSL